MILFVEIHEMAVNKVNLWFRMRIHHWTSLIETIEYLSWLFGKRRACLQRKLGYKERGEDYL